MTIAAPVQLVGSVSLPDVESVFRAVATVGAERIPDGEVGDRFYWIQFQKLLFDEVDGLERVGEPGFKIRGLFDVRLFRQVGPVDLPPLGYADAAIESYGVFTRLRDAGEIAAGTRFQVSLPTAAGVVAASIVPEERAEFELVYRDALLREVAAITEAIPAEDLAIQWDVATEFAIFERDRKPVFQIEPWWDGVDVAGVVERLSVLGAAVPDGVQLGYHLCYGDVEEEHFVQPEDASLLARVAGGAIAGIDRRVDWIHLPVPIDRDDEAYFAPLADVEWGETQVFLGLVHHEDGVEGAVRRAVAARTAVGSFGIGTECGFGRGPEERTQPLLRLHREISDALAA
ncbi:hypothetical protein [uncultured Agrococcus sp.]|uniref:hypothetical protein n=1 Tax=uncultured Agrococcus sp. TaxID=382258 RepID=UPI0025E303EF|nr:hypothetical protein [uncultured Agrococcus sp.]